MWLIVEYVSSICETRVLVLSTEQQGKSRTLKKVVLRKLHENSVLGKLEAIGGAGFPDEHALLQQNASLLEFCFPLQQRAMVAFLSSPRPAYSMGFEAFILVLVYIPGNGIQDLIDAWQVTIPDLQFESKAHLSKVEIDTLL